MQFGKAGSYRYRHLLLLHALTSVGQNSLALLYRLLKLDPAKAWNSKNRYLTCSAEHPHCTQWTISWLLEGLGPTQRYVIKSLADRRPSLSSFKNPLHQEPCIGGQKAVLISCY